MKVSQEESSHETTEDYSLPVQNVEKYLASGGGGKPRRGENQGAQTLTGEPDF